MKGIQLSLLPLGAKVYCALLLVGLGILIGGISFGLAYATIFAVSIYELWFRKEVHP